MPSKLCVLFNVKNNCILVEKKNITIFTNDLHIATNFWQKKQKLKQTILNIFEIDHLMLAQFIYGNYHAKIAMLFIIFSQ